MTTIKGLKEAIQGLPDDYPVLVHDTRSGAVEEASFGKGKFSEGDDEYGVDLPVGTPTFNIYI